MSYEHCGIGLIANLKKEKDNKEEIISITKKLFLALQKRGESASGIASILPENEEKEFAVLKKPLKADAFINTESFKEFIEKYWNSRLLLLHTRAATKGSPSLNFNNHPMISKNFLIVHNGVIHDDAEPIMNDLITSSDFDLWDRRVETDSYMINKI